MRKYSVLRMPYCLVISPYHFMYYSEYITLRVVLSRV